jgi:glutamyl-tRNA synthetase
MSERGRFAPSPTGELHLGNARTALLSWLWARAAGGSYLLRVEDLDAPRVRPGLAEQQMDELRWLGLDWDFAVLCQSTRAAAYDAAIEQLGDQVYECFCSRAEIAAASAPHALSDEGPRYPGTCRALTRAQRDERRRLRAPAIRLRVPEGAIAFDDELAGPQAFDVQAQVGDFVLRRADGVHSYQLAVVVDDAFSEVTQVLRGADLLPSTARQLILYRLLGRPAPRWAHAPLVLSASGERLAKRDRAVSLSALRAEGRDPAAVVARLALLSGLPPRGSPRELLDGFSLRLVPRAAPRIGALP